MPSPQHTIESNAVCSERTSLLIMNETVNDSQTMGQNCDVNTISSDVLCYQANDEPQKSSYQNANIRPDSARPFAQSDMKPPKSIYHKICPLVTKTRPIDDLSAADLIEILKSINWTACIFSAGSVGLTWLWKIIDTDYDSTVFASFLTCFAFLLLASEIAILLQYRTTQGKKVRCCTQQSPYPWGKPILLVAVAALTWGLTGIWESILGGIYFAAALAAVHAWLATPEFRPNCCHDEETPPVPSKKSNDDSVEKTMQFESDELACTPAER